MVSFSAGITPRLLVRAKDGLPLVLPPDVASHGTTNPAEASRSSHSSSRIARARGRTRGRDRSVSLSWNLVPILLLCFLAGPYFCFFAGPYSYCANDTNPWPASCNLGQARILLHPSWGRTNAASHVFQASGVVV